MKHLPAMVAACAAVWSTADAGSVKLAWDANPESDIAGYRLSYGTSPGSHAKSLSVGNVTSAMVHELTDGDTYYFVVRAVNTAGLESDPSDEISHTPPNRELIANTGWSILSVDSQEAPDHAAYYAIDGDPSTFWHTAWRNGTATPPPHHLQIDLGKVESIAGFRYLPRQDTGVNGDIAGYEFYVSMDGVNWGNPVTGGQFDNTKFEKEVLFPTASGRYVMLLQLTEVNDSVHCAVAELSLIRGEGETLPPAQENHPPTATAASVTTDEDQPVPITLTASDPDGDPLIYQIVSQPLLGVLSGTAPDLTYIPHANVNGSDSFTFRVSDGELTSDTVTVSIAIHPVNDAPVAVSQAITAAAGVPVAITLRGTDVDGDLLSYQVRSTPTQGTLSGTAPNLTYTPAASAGGRDSFTFRVSDGQLYSNTATVSITIAAAAPSPVALIPNTEWLLVFASTEETTHEDGQAIHAIDGDPDSFWHSKWSNDIATPPHELRIDLGKTESIKGFRYLPRQDGGTNGNIGGYEFHVSSDGINWGSPVASGNFANDQTEKEVLFASTSARYILLRAFHDAAGNVFCAVAELSLIQGDTGSLPAQENRPPTASSATVATDEDVPVAITLSASDPDGDDLTYQILDQPEMGSLSGTAPDLTYTPAADVNGSDSFTFRVSDGELTSATATISITIRPVNDAPVAASQTVTTAEDNAVGILLQASDKDGDPLSFRITSHPAMGRLSGSAPNLTYTPNRDYHGSDSFEFVANDGIVDSSPATVTIIVTPVNDPPVVISRMVSTPSDSSLAITLLASDVDGDPLTYRIVSQPMKGRLSGTAPHLNYSPNPRVSGSDSFSFLVNDGTVDSGIATVFISLTAPLNQNRPPVFIEPRIGRSTGTAESPYTCSPLEGTAIDPDGDLVAYDKSAGPDWLEVGPDGTLGGTPPAAAAGLNTFTIRARDPEGAYSEALLEIHVDADELPLPWTMERIGEAGDESTAHGVADSLTLSGSGKLASKSDSGLLVWQTLTGDGDITARISSLENAGSASRAGLTIRETLAADSKHTFIGVDGTGYVRWMRRTRIAGNTSISAVAYVDPEAVWLRLTRTGDTVRAFTSADGDSWAQVASTNIDLGSSSYIGLAVASGSEEPATAVFNNVTVTP